jgi:succinate dehydrogenase / fumarate reductase cytochrome b subunit
MTGVALSLGAVGLVALLTAAALGPRPFSVMQNAILSWPGRILLFAFTFAFFLHLCGGIRHLVWDTVHGFELPAIYASGWAVVAISVLLTIAAWAASVFLGS